MNELINITSALSDETRVRVLLALDGRELCLCQIIELFGLSQSTLSRHMRILRDAGLVESRKDGKWSWFRLPDSPAHVVAGALEWVRESSSSSESVRDDRERLIQITGEDLEEVCRRIYR